MTEIIKFPGGAEPPVVDANKLHAEAFEEIECDIADVDRMAQIARDLIMDCSAAHDAKEFHNLEMATFAVWMIAKMTDELRKKYQALWDGKWVRP